MTRSNPSFLHLFDPEIDRTFHRPIREHIIPCLDSDSHSVSVASEIDSSQLENMGEQPYNGPRGRTLREMAAPPDFTYESLCIQYPEGDVPFVLKTGLIYLFPKFHGHAVAKDWLYYLAPKSITSWDDLKKMFLDKFFPASRTTAIRKDISGIRQLGGESLYEYWERFKKLCVSYPHHQISE
uniref:Uncharacterized protein n=1 Tax=Cajanus cajan TaxID=3821 RepID=A0A151UHZ6_CAJCA